MIAIIKLNKLNAQNNANVTVFSIYLLRYIVRNRNALRIINNTIIRTRCLLQTFSDNFAQ